MSRLAPPLPASESNNQPTPESAPVAAEDSQEARNFVWLALHNVLLRVGWIFKTESIVMPAFLSHIGGSSTLLGLMPVLNRLGLSIPPLLYARRLKLMPRKKRSVVMTTMAMALPFAALSILWQTGALGAALMARPQPGCPLLSWPCMAPSSC